MNLACFGSRAFSSRPFYSSSTSLFASPRSPSLFPHSCSSFLNADHSSVPAKSFFSSFSQSPILKRCRSSHCPSPFVAVPPSSSSSSSPSFNFSSSPSRSFSSNRNEDSTTQKSSLEADSKASSDRDTSDQQKKSSQTKTKISTEMMILSSSLLTLPIIALILDHDNSMSDEELIEEVIKKQNLLEDPSSNLDVLSDELFQIADPFLNKSFIERVGYFFYRIYRILETTVAFTPLMLWSPLLSLFPKSEWVRTTWKRYLVWVLGYLGPCYIKLGQWAATRRDLFPEDVCCFLSSLHTGAPSHSFEKSKLTIESSFGKPIEEIFDDFEIEPIASGAIAQVHRAKIKGTDSIVAVKVRHPNVVTEIYTDLKIVENLAAVAEIIFPSLKWMDFDGVIASFAKSMKAQLDLAEEARNLKIFADNFRDFDRIIFSVPYEELTNEKVLVESFEPGIQISEYISNEIRRKEGINYQLARLGFISFLKMLLIDNFVHGDLHPGNILVREREDGPEIVLLDVGLVTHLSEKDRANFIDLIAAIVTGDSKRGATLMVERSKHVLNNPELLRQYTEKMGELFNEVLSKPLSQIPIGPAFMDAMEISRECQVKIEGSFSSLVAGLIVVEGLARQLHADFDIISEVRPLLLTDRSTVNALIKGKIKSIFSTN